MVECIVFAGTTEGIAICRFLQKYRISTLVCVATEYGSHSYCEDDFLRVQASRLTAEEMAELFHRESPQLVIDATHPYAAVVTENIKAACEKHRFPYLRLLREAGEKDSQAVYVDSAKEAAEYLCHTEGNVLLTTGSKELREFTIVPDYQHRLYARVLSLPKVMTDCAALGYEGKNLIGMQGPFTREINEAMLRQYQCSYLVTKDTGTAGGFQEKIDACASCHVTPVIIGRPVQDTGLSMTECKREIIQRFGITVSQTVSLVGIGMGDPSSLTLEGENALRSASLLIGAKRMADAVRKPGQAVYYEYNSQKIADYIGQHPEYESIAIVLSGDVGFYSGAKKLLELLPDAKLICGISSVVAFMAKIRESWDDAVIVSSHGRSCNLVDRIRHHRKVFSILGTSDGVAQLAKKLLRYGMGDVILHVGENLSYEDENIFCKPASSLTDYEGSALSVVTAINERALKRPSVHGIPDGEFLRGKAPMTKEEVRTVSLSKLHLTADSVCYDVGAGTGSVSIEMALRACDGEVYAIEKKEDALVLLEENKLKFAADNLTIVSGTAPEAMKELPAPSHAFIGGSSGNLDSIVSLLLDKNPGIRIVINCITLETVTEALQVIRKYELDDHEIVQLCASRSKSVAGYHMMMGENPIYIITAQRKEDLR